MTRDTQRSGRPAADPQPPGCPGPELDSAAAEALALVTLCVSGRSEDAELAGSLMAHDVGDPDAAARIVRGLISACAALLALHEYQTGAMPEQTLHELGGLVARAAYFA